MPKGFERYRPERHEDQGGRGNRARTTRRQSAGVKQTGSLGRKAE